MEWGLYGFTMFFFFFFFLFSFSFIPRKVSTSHTERGRSLLCAKVPVRIGRIGIFVANTFGWQTMINYHSIIKVALDETSSCTMS